MAVQVVINLLLSLFWLLVTGSYTVNNFLLGFILGLLLVYLLRSVLPGRFYIITLYKVIKLIWVFLPASCSLPPRCERFFSSDVFLWYVSSSAARSPRCDARDVGACTAPASADARGPG